MWIFNRIVVSLIFLGLVVLGVYGVLYSFDLFGYRFSNLAESLRLPSVYSEIENLVGSTEGGELGAAPIAVLVAVAIVGLILLVMELKPARPRFVRMGQGTTATRKVIESEVVSAAKGAPGVLQSTARVKARRRPGAKIKLKAGVRRGEDRGGTRSEIQDRVRQQLERRGVPTGRLKVKVEEVNPREASSRVR
jgi:hypothetical protein